MLEQRIDFLGCPFDPVDSTFVIERVVEWCRAPRRAHTVLTMNASILVMMRDDPALEQACVAGDLIVADGVPVVWATRLIGRPLPSRVAGVDLFVSLLARASLERLRVFFLGAKEDVLQRLIERCERLFPGVQIVGRRNGYFGEPDHATIVEQIRSSQADLLFVGMPTPFKEVWCERHRDALGVPAIIGVGGSFDVFAGHVRRAPAWLQRSGLEWSWRLMMEPRKMWKRYLVCNTLFIARTAKAMLQERRTQS